MNQIFIFLLHASSPPPTASHNFHIFLLCLRRLRLFRLFFRICFHWQSDADAKFPPHSWKCGNPNLQCAICSTTRHRRFCAYYCVGKNSIKHNHNNHRRTLLKIIEYENIKHIIVIDRSFDGQCCRLESWVGEIDSWEFLLTDYNSCTSSRFIDWTFFYCTYESVRFSFLLPTIANCLLLLLKRKKTENERKLMRPEPALSSMQSKLSAVKYILDLFVSVSGVSSLSWSLLHHFAMVLSTSEWKLNIARVNKKLYLVVWWFAVLRALTANAREWKRIMVRFMLSDLIRTSKDECAHVDNVMPESMPSDTLTFVQHCDLCSIHSLTDRCIQWKINLMNV